MNLHAFFVHFPIALYFVSVLGFVFYQLKPGGCLKKIYRWSSLSTAIVLIPAVLSGYLAKDQLTEVQSWHPTLSNHIDFMMTFAVLVWLKVLYFVMPGRIEKGHRIWLAALHLVLLVILVWGSHLGGVLVYELGFGMTP
jgi:uncharacterized membrane protein